jgi:hypothetical protein
MEREALRAKTTDLIQRLRGENIPQALWELLDVFAARLDRIELGHFESQDDVPTAPRGISSANFPAVKPEPPVDERVKAIFEKAKPKKPKKDDGEEEG